MNGVVTPEEIVGGEEVDFDAMKEEWNEYKLKDGTTLKVKLVLTGVRRLQKFNPDGSPVYMIYSQNIVRAVNVPKQLRIQPRPPTTPRV